MTRGTRLVALAWLLSASVPVPALGEDLTLPSDGRVVIELIGSQANYRNTLSVVSPAVAIAVRGCGLEGAGGLPGVHVLSERQSQRGCRVELDADAATPGLQTFTAGTTLRFGFCAQTDSDAACEHVWSSDPSQNGDDEDHVRTTQVAPGAFRLNWEDLPDLGDEDFNDLIVVVRVVADTDGDGLWDDWETSGVDSDGDGTADHFLAGADPLRKDIYVEIDWMDCAVAGSDCAPGDVHSHQPRAAAIAAVVTAFDAANVQNPGGRPDGIALHLELGNAVPHQNALIIPNACFAGAAGTGFDAVKADPANFGPDNPRRFTHRYMLWTHQQVAGETWSGCAELPGNDSQVSLGGWNYRCVGGTTPGFTCNVDADCAGTGATCTPAGDIDGDGLADGDVGTVQQQAGTLMHELGHNLELQHGGGDWTNNKPNYISVMNYTFQLGGISPGDPDGGGPLTARIDYSRQALPTLVESDLSEAAGIGDGTDRTFFACPGSNVLGGSAIGNTAIDWNCDGDTTDTNVSVDLNLDRFTFCVAPGGAALDTTPAGDDAVVFGQIFEGPNRQCDTFAAGDDIQWRPVGPLSGFFDWGSIRYDFQATADFDDGQHTDVSVQVRELTYERYLEQLAPDVQVAMSATPDPVVTGSTVTYRITLSNPRPTPAANVVLTDVLPATTTFVSCATTGGGLCGGTGNQRTVTFASLPAGGTAEVTIVAEVQCAVPDGTLVANRVSVAAAEDVDPGNNTAEAVVTASNPPPAIGPIAASATVLWPADHRLVDVTLGYEVVDNCGPVRLALDVSSNEAPDGLGDGRTSPDWVVVGPRHVRLRAERSGLGSGRIYTLTVTATDSAGGASARRLTVLVPHNR